LTDIEPVIHVLEQGGFTLVLECVNTFEALHTSLEQQEWDVVVSDHETPSQAEVLKALRLVRKMEFDLPFIVISGHSSEAFVARAFEEGADRFMLKNQLGRLVPIIDHELHKLEHRRGCIAKAIAAEESCKTAEMLVTGLLHEMQSSMLAEQQLLVFMTQDRFGPLQESQLALLEEIIQSKRQTGQLVENIFWVFDERTHKTQDHLERADLNRIIYRDIVPAFGSEIKFKQLSLQMVLEPELPEVEIDVLGIHLTLKNLIQNALSQAQPGGVIRLVTQIRGLYVVCMVENTDTTLDANYLEHLFKVCDSSGQVRFRTPVAFGLYLAQKVLDACHGELGMEIQPGAGSAFLLKLPIP
jgi:light-regulated signal transduction histidine kinase (bacteriophytochrome)